MNMTELVKRTLSGTAYVGVMVAAILYHEVVFLVLSIGLAFLAVREYNTLVRVHRLIDSFGEWSVLCSVFPCILAWVYPDLFSPLVLLTLLLPLAALIAELWDTEGNPIQNWGHLLIGQMMIVLPFALMNVLEHISPYVLLAVFVLIWTNDTGAYCVGSLTAKLPKGNHKMFPRVSPKKSWEGLFGGMALAVGGGALLAYFGWFDGIGTTLNPYLTGICFALVVSVFGTLGDLMESLFKRTIGVKDSGKFLPGHGGVLDRFDSILLAAPVALLLVIILQQC